MTRVPRGPDDERLLWFLREMGRFPDPAELIAVREQPFAAGERRVEAKHEHR